MDADEYAIKVFQNHIECSGMKECLHGCTILEIGPGDSIASAIIAAGYGAKSIIVDADRYVREDIHIYHALNHSLAEKGFPCVDISHCQSVDDILAVCNACYMTNGLTSLRSIKDNSVDLIFSQAVLEHIRRDEFLSTMIECRRILRPGGSCSHQIDLRDHLGGALNNLRFSEKTWESRFFSNSGFYTNRIRYGQMLELFAQAGFHVEVTNIQRWAEIPTPRSMLAGMFSSFSDEDLRISCFDVLLR